MLNLFIFFMEADEISLMTRNVLCIEDLGSYIIIDLGMADEVSQTDAEKVNYASITM